MKEVLTTARALLGQPVIVTLAFEGHEPAVVARGQLLATADSGEIVVRDDAGFVHYAWPMLDIAADTEVVIEIEADAGPTVEAFTQADGARNLPLGGARPTENEEPT